MMRKLKLIIPCMLLLLSCGSDETTTTIKEKDTTATVDTPEKIKLDEEELVGQYMGSFGKSTLILKLNYVKGKNASGYNIVRGTKRNIKGKVSVEDSVFHFVMEEPGDNKYDGKFEFDINYNTFVLDGKWTPNSPEYAQEKTFKLKKYTPTDQNDPLLKEWFGTINEQYGSLLLKSDGTLIFKGNHYNEAADRYTDFSIKGTWIESGNKINLELESHKFTRYTQLSLTKINEGDDEFSSWILEDKDKAAFYEYF